MGPRFSGRGARVQVEVEPGYVQVLQGSLGLTLRKCGPARNLAQSGTGTGPNLSMYSIRMYSATPASYSTSQSSINGTWEYNAFYPSRTHVSVEASVSVIDTLSATRAPPNYRCTKRCGMLVFPVKRLPLDMTTPALTSRDEDVIKLPSESAGQTRGSCQTSFR